MDDNRFEELVLCSIDQLRKLKARPDFERICHMLNRRYGIKKLTVKDELARLVKKGTVFQVYYKGNISYRNAAKWSKSKSCGKLFHSDISVAAVVDAIDILSLQSTGEITSDRRSVSVQELEAYLTNQECESLLDSSILCVALNFAVSDGLIEKLPSGEFIKIADTSDLAKSPAQQMKAEKQSNTMIIRPASTRKRFKKTHGPDFLDSNSILLLSEGLGPMRCDYCLLTADANINGDKESLLVCKDCNAKAHPSCVDYKLSKCSETLWQCADCKICIICKNSSNGDFLVCSLCHKGYHVKCHFPVVTMKPKVKWICSNCHKYPTCKDKKDVKVSPFKTVPKSVSICNSPLNDNGVDKLKGGESVMIFFKECLKEYPDVIPHAENWSTEDVEMFFKCIGYADEASAFREQEIDGQSLLLLKRNDVLTGLALKLGSALKIYAHIERLQSKVPPICDAKI